jgi:hypothetical protein
MVRLMEKFSSQENRSGRVESALRRVNPSAQLLHWQWWHARFHPGSRRSPD